ncbi:MAG: hypothetical protein COU31_03050 [Candidatus Magasanikbacteria bacterium CG10_big_fil_rev_8_21_14_0_10_40_10]|uniref:Uncharacterized protein n=1 Tax=Candidatus Magasanikbacteria bacterium CG10_big_fil_rev_8_21_14_0_10_40_10 TaxID=1974648 RepID=A0A2M6W3P0_9BACT|nr:MAG: hypothetical protein COU31_03050 [Candidatus Magasanikbacteria bacterium CG10_big_fil_rev_8_21_14_0_10_40_10]
MNKHIISFILLFLTAGFGGCANSNIQISKDRLASIGTSTVKITAQTDFYPPIMHTAKWLKPEPLAGGVNTSGAEDSPFITPDGQNLYFFFTPDPNIPVQKQVSDGVTGIYISRLNNGQWSQAERVVLQDKNKLSLDGCEFVQADTIWFCAARQGYTDLNWFTAQYKDGRWQNWKIAPQQFKDYQIGELHFTTDKQQIYFHSDRSGGLGQYDIWMSEIKNGIIQPPINISAVNSPQADGWPYISQNGEEMYFTRTYLGSPSIWRSQKINGQWQTPELLISQFAGEPSLDNQGNLYFVHHYYKDNKMLEADIYVARQADKK